MEDIGRRFDSGHRAIWGSGVAGNLSKKVSQAKSALVRKSDIG
jgi:hypothetical protein